MKKEIWEETFCEEKKLVILIFCEENIFVLNKKLWEKKICDKNSITQILTKLKNSNFYKTPKLKLWQISKTQIATKFKNSNCDETQKLKLWLNSKT